MMIGDFKEYSARLEQMDARCLVGVALEEVRAKVPGLAVLYADVGRRFNLEGLRGGTASIPVSPSRI